MYALIDPAGRIYVTLQPVAALWPERNVKAWDHTAVHQWLRGLPAPPAELVLPVPDGCTKRQAIDALREANPGKLVNAPRAGRG
jgi:hypothetical protein